MTTAQSHVQKLLNSGLCLKVLYQNNKKSKFVYLINSNFLNLTKINKTFYENKNLIINVCLDTVFEIKNKNITGIEYILNPDYINIEDILNDKKIDLENNDEYILSLSDTILKINLDLRDYMFLYDVNNENYYNQAILSFYPNHEKFLKNSKRFKLKIVNKYFTIDNKSFDDSSDLKLKYCLEYLGIDVKNIDVQDELFINSLKLKWRNIIKIHKEKILKKLTSKEVFDDMDEEEKKEYMIEFEIYRNELSKDIDKEVDKLNSLKEIISFWPEFIQPIPYFVYDN